MATQAQVEELIKMITPILQEEAKIRGYKIVSPAIAQALQESLTGSGYSQLATKYHNYHGMKCGKYWLSQGKPSVSLKTGEEYTPGTITQITDYFRKYPDMRSGLIGYYEFLEMKRYAAVRSAQTPEQYMNAIKAAGYCTSSTYVKNCLGKITKYNLTQYDSVLTGCTSATNSERYVVGKNYTLQNNMYIRDAAAGNKKKFLQLTTNAKSHAYEDSENNGILKKGTVVTCKGIEKVGDATWMKIPSGWVCAINSDGTIFIK